MNNQVLAGQGSCLSVYDKNEKEFVTQSMSVSNKVLKDMLIKNKFDPKTDLEAAAKEEAEIASARREARSFAENIVAARDILGLQKPKGYGTAPHPMTTLGGTLGKIQSNLDTYLLQNHDPRDFFAEQKQLCHQAIKKAASSIRFIAGKRLLNAVASVLKFKPPFEKLQELDTLKKNIVSTAPSISSRVIR